MGDKSGNRGVNLNPRVNLNAFALSLFDYNFKTKIYGGRFASRV